MSTFQVIPAVHGFGAGPEQSGHVPPISDFFNESIIPNTNSVRDKILIPSGNRKILAAAN